MKFFNKLSAAMLSVALMAGFASCTETADYDAPSVPTNAQVHFSNAESSTISLGFEQDSFAVKVYRAEAGAELVVPLNIVSDSADVFTFPEEVVFEADSTVAYIPVTFDFANIAPDTDYPISIELLGDEVTPYGASKVNLVVKYAPWSEWTEFATGYNELSVYWAGTLSDIQVYQRESLLDPTKQQFAFVNYPGYEMVIDYDVTTNRCRVGVTDINFNHETYGAMYIADSETYLELRPTSTIESKPSSFDPETGVFSLHLVYFVGAGAFTPGYEYLHLDGYASYDYSISLEERGHYVDLKGVDNALIYMHKGADVDTYKYAIAAGNDLNALLGGILDGSVESTEVSESGYQLFPLTEAGEYTVVAVTYDKEGNAQEANYITFEFAPVGQSSPWESMGMATYREDIVASVFGVDNLVYQVEIEKNVETPGLYRLVNPYGPAYGYNASGEYDDSKNHYLVIDAQDPAKVNVIESYTGLNLGGYGEIGIMSMADYVLSQEGTTEEDALPYYGKLENGVITFPGQGLLAIMGDGLYIGNKNGKFAVALPGYELPEDEATEEGGEEEGGEEEGGEESSARIRRNDVKSIGKISLKGRPADANVIANYLQSNIR